MMQMRGRGAGGREAWAAGMRSVAGSETQRWKPWAMLPLAASRGGRLP
jgi:hypothetical protein